MFQGAREGGAQLGGGGGGGGRSGPWSRGRRGRRGRGGLGSGGLGSGALYGRLRRGGAVGEVARSRLPGAGEGEKYGGGLAAGCGVDDCAQDGGHALVDGGEVGSGDQDETACGGMGAQNEFEGKVGGDGGSVVGRGLESEHQGGLFGGQSGDGAGAKWGKGGVGSKRNLSATRAEGDGDGGRLCHGGWGWGWAVCGTAVGGGGGCESESKVL